MTYGKPRCHPWEGICDEYHYFLHCNHVLLELSRDNFINKIRNTIESLILLDSHHLVVYMTMMSDRNITDISAKFIHELMNCWQPGVAENMLATCIIATSL